MRRLRPDVPAVLLETRFADLEDVSDDDQAAAEPSRLRSQDQSRRILTPVVGPKALDAQVVRFRICRGIGLAWRRAEYVRGCEQPAADLTPLVRHESGHLRGADRLRKGVDDQWDHGLTAFGLQLQHPALAVSTFSQPLAWHPLPERGRRIHCAMIVLSDALSGDGRDQRLHENPSVSFNTQPFGRLVQDLPRP